MLRLTEVASQSVTFAEAALRKAKTNTVKSLNKWMAHPATTPLCFLLTGRLYWLFGLVRATSFRTNRSASRPVCITYSLEIHLEKAYRLLAGHDPVSDLPPSTILADRRVANRH